MRRHWDIFESILDEVVETCISRLIGGQHFPMRFLVK